MALNSIIVDLNKGEKLNSFNYIMRHQKNKYLLNEQKIRETLTNSLEKPSEGNK